MGDPSAFLGGGGETGALMAARDWSQTSLGPIADWPQSLRTATSILLRSTVPMVMLWGEDGVMLYNDAYSAFAGGRHPRLLGSQVREGWPEVAEFNDNVMRVGLAGGTLAYRDQELTLHRHGVPEQVWMDLDYSPVPDESGRPAGVIAIVVETTARVRAERQAGAERERLAQMFEQAPGFMCMLRGPEHRFEFVNAAYMRLVGHRDILGRTVAEALPEAVAQGYLDLLDGVYRSGRAHRADRAKFVMQGEPDAPLVERFVDFVYQPVVDPDGQVAGIFVEGSDVTEQVSGEASRRESEERLRLVIEGAKDHAIFTTDSAGLVTSWLAGAEAIFGWTAEEIVGRPASVLFTPEDRAIGADTHEFATAARHGYANDERWHLRKDGDRVFMNGSVHLLPRDAHGHERGYIKIARDETERRRVDEALREARGLNAPLLESSRDCIVVLDLEGHTQWVSPGGIEGMEVADVEAIIGLSWLRVWTGADHEAARAAVAEARAGGTGQFEGFCATHGGRPKWWDVAISPVPGPDGRPHRLISVARDITARKHAELDLKELNETLEHRVAEELAERTKAEDQLRQAQKMEAVGQLTGGLAHDFNNLLAGISGNLELMQTRIAQGRTGDIDRYLSAAQGASRRAAALTHRLLAFSRRQTLDPKPTDVNRLVAGMEELIRRTVGPAVAIEVVGSSGLWATLVDPPQLENALLNLCINARDAMPDGGRITVETANKWLDDRAAREHDMPAGQYVTLCVTDTGTGMPPDIVARVFDPFFTTKPMGQGTGLGLSMIYGFVRQSGGQVRIYSEVGAGTTVCLYLPRHYGQADEIEALPDLGDAPRAEAGLTVLVVDDEPTVRILIVEVLEELGYVAIEAADSAAGLKILQSDMRIDLLVTDVGLPGGLNGRQMVDAARGHRPHLKVLFITGYAENALLGHGHLEPGMQVMTKPFVMEALASRIDDLIKSG